MVLLRPRNKKPPNSFPPKIPCSTPPEENLAVSEICNKISSQHDIFKKALTDQTYICKLCKTSFCSSAELQSHDCKPIKNKLQCETCYKGFSSFTTFTDHFQIHHPSTKIKLTFVCEICNKVFINRGVLKKHYRTHSDKKPFVISNNSSTKIPYSNPPEENMVLLKPCSEEPNNSDPPKIPCSAPPEENLAVFQACNKELPNSPPSNISCCTPPGENMVLSETCNKISSQHDIFKKALSGQTYICKLCKTGFCSYADLKSHDCKPIKKKLQCETCIKGFSNFTALADHLEIQHRSKKIKVTLVCEICNKFIINRGVLKKHYRTHSDKNPFVISNSSSTKIPLSNPPGENMVVLKTCNKEPPNSVPPKIPCSTPPEENLAMSETCNKISSQHGIFKKALAEQIYICKLCKTSFCSYTELQSHDCKPIKDKLGCETCYKGFSRFTTFTNHFRIHHPSTKIKVTFVCEICNNIFINRGVLKKHYRTHSDKKPCVISNSSSAKIPYSDPPEENMVLRPCSKEPPNSDPPKISYSVPPEENLAVFHTCNKELPNSSPSNISCSTLPGENMVVSETCNKISSQHIFKKAFSGQTYICKLCETSFCSYADLKSHDCKPIKKKLQCETCNNGFSNFTTLAGHFLIQHPGENVEITFVCEMCNQIFVYENVLQNHYRTHFVKKPFICDVCYKKFYFLVSLYAHYNIHAKTDPLVCEICGRSFICEEKLNRHLSRHSLEKTVTQLLSQSSPPEMSHLKKSEESLYACSKCNQGFIYKISLKYHHCSESMQVLLMPKHPS